MRRLIPFTSMLILLCAMATAHAQFGDDKDPVKPGTTKPGDPAAVKEATRYYKVGLVVRANACSCTGVIATLPFPTKWPEQDVRITNEDFSPAVKSVKYRKLPGGAKQMLIAIPRLELGERAHVYVTFEVKRRTVIAPTDTDQFEIPTKVDSATRLFLRSSPFIETTNAKIKALAPKLIEGKETAWEKVEAIYDWVRDNVEYKNGPLKGALAALEDKTGDCEELTSLFIALCRVNKIPARTVWVPDHCYPEFYLVDSEGKGHWFPCQAAGTRDFGSMPDLRPVLQKGDNFKVPEKRKPQRYIAEFLKAKAVKGNGQPVVEFIRQPMAKPN